LELIGKPAPPVIQYSPSGMVRVANARLVKILIGLSERAMLDPQGSMMDPDDARSISLGTPAVICDRSRQSRIVAA
jgi:hypothetical protein